MQAAATEHGMAAAALDLSPAMASYGRGLAARAGAAVDYREGDMANFDLSAFQDPTPFDTVADRPQPLNPSTPQPLNPSSTP